MKIEKLLLITIISTFFLPLTGCDSFLDFLNDGENSSSKTSSKNNDDNSSIPGVNDYLHFVSLHSDEWYSFSDLSFMDLDHFMSITLGSRNGITLKLVGDLKNYNVFKVQVFAKSKKPYATGLFWEESWPTDSSGNCKGELYIKTGFTGSYGFTAYISSIYGFVKPTDSFYEDKNGFVWKKIVSDVDKSISYSFSGCSNFAGGELLKIPATIGEIVPTKIGCNSFDMFGLKGVKKIIIPSNYTNITLQPFWKNVDFEEFYYEGGENDITTNYFLPKTSIRMYRENEPDPNIDSDEYIYWHYVDGYPQIW